MFSKWLDYPIKQYKPNRGRAVMYPDTRGEGRLPLPLFNLMIDKETKRLAKKRAQELRRNPPKITQEHREGAERLYQQHKDFEAQKDRDIVRERQAFSKDVAGYVYNHVSGIGAMIHGIGPGKKPKCAFPGCGKHEGTMFNMNDGNWYDSEHKWFGNLSQEQKEKELSYA